MQSVGRRTAYNTGQALVAALLGLRHIFASAVATAKTSPAPGTLYEIAPPYLFGTPAVLAGKRKLWT